MTQRTRRTWKRRLRTALHWADTIGALAVYAALIATPTIAMGWPGLAISAALLPVSLIFFGIAFRIAHRRQHDRS